MISPSSWEHVSCTKGAFCTMRKCTKRSAGWISSNYLKLQFIHTSEGWALARGLPLSPYIYYLLYHCQIWLSKILTAQEFDSQISLPDILKVIKCKAEKTKPSRQCLKMGEKRWNIGETLFIWICKHSRPKSTYWGRKIGKFFRMGCWLICLLHGLGALCDIRRVVFLGSCVYTCTAHWTVRLSHQ